MSAYFIWLGKFLHVEEVDGVQTLIDFISSTYLVIDEDGLYIQYPFEYMSFLYSWEEDWDCPYFPSGKAEEYDPRCWKFYEDIVNAFPVTSLTEPYISPRSDTIHYISVMGKALPKEDGRPTSVMTGTTLNLSFSDDFLESLNTEDSYYFQYNRDL